MDIFQAYELNLFNKTSNKLLNYSLDSLIEYYKKTDVLFTEASDALIEEIIEINKKEDLLFQTRYRQGYSKIFRGIQFFNKGIQKITQGIQKISQGYSKSY